MFQITHGFSTPHNFSISPSTTIPNSVINLVAQEGYLTVNANRYELSLVILGNLNPNPEEFQKLDELHKKNGHILAVHFYNTAGESTFTGFYDLRVSEIVPLERSGDFQVRLMPSEP